MVTVSLQAQTHLTVEGEDGVTNIQFDHAIIAAGSRPIQLPLFHMKIPYLGLNRCA